MAHLGAVVTGPGVVVTHLDAMASELAAGRAIDFGVVRVRTATRATAANSTADHSAGVDSAGIASVGEDSAGIASGSKTNRGAATLALEVERAAPPKRRPSALGGQTQSGPWHMRCCVRCANRMLTQIYCCQICCASGALRAGMRASPRN